MYKTILVMLDGTQTDRAIISHIKRLAMLAESQVVLLHVADRWAARTFGPDAIKPLGSPKTLPMKRGVADFQSVGIPVAAELAYGDPVAK